MQISFVMLFLLLFSNQFLGGIPRGHSIITDTGGLARRSESKTPKYLSKNGNI